MSVMSNPPKKWNPTRDPKDAWDYNLPDPSSLESFDGPFDPIDHKDGRKLSEEETGIRLLAYLARYGSEVYKKSEWNCDDYQTADRNDPSFTTAARNTDPSLQRDES